MATRVGIIGGSGYTGAELLRLCAQHPDLDVAWATGDTQAGNPIAGLYPSLAAHYGDATFATYAPQLIDDVDLVFLALPHGESQKLAPQLVDKDVKIVDLAADFRLDDAALYPRWYHDEHAAPGCYPTAAGLALAPFTRTGTVETTGVVVDAASGLSGAGRGLKHTSHFGTVNEDFTAYGLLDHRHTPEIELITGAQVLFTPHLAPMTRGILATCYARPTDPAGTSTTTLLDALHAAYDDEPFVVVRTDTDTPPSTKATWGSNSAHVTARYDERTGWVVAIAAIDNLVKGASGQAVQCANILLGLDEAAGLSNIGVYP